METQRKRQGKRKDGKPSSPIFSKCLLSRKTTMEVKYVGKNIKSLLERKIKAEIEGKCMVEGYIKNDSVELISYSSGVIQGNGVQFDIVISCMVCYPVEGMLITCTAKNITKAGIRGEIANEDPSPIVCFVSRDHHINSPQFTAVKEGEKFICRIIGQKFELNDKYVSVLGEIPIEREKQK